MENRPLSSKRCNCYSMLLRKCLTMSIVKLSCEEVRQEEVEDRCLVVVVVVVVVVARGINGVFVAHSLASERG